jgi:hypothetical protein
MLLGFALTWQIIDFTVLSVTTWNGSQENKQSPSVSALLDLSDFHYLLNNEVLCNPSQLSDKSKLLIVLIHSARQNLESREAIRHSWALVRKYSGWEVRLLFLIGAEDPFNPETTIEERNLINSTIEVEEEKYSDMLMGSFYDVYRNMTYKHLMGYKWILEYCPNANFLLRVDDDVFVDIFQVIELISSKEVNLESDSLYCYLSWERPVERGNDSKWSVTEEEFPLDVYPNYCLGVG